MTVLGLLTGLLTLLAGGVGATLLLMRGATRINLFECTALGWLFGSGIIALLLWAGGLFLSGLPLQLSVAATAVALARAGFASVRKEHGRLVFPKPRNALEWSLAGAIALEIVVLIYSSFGHGLGWDGLLNWEVKARYAFFNDGVLPAAYYSSETRAFTHPAYPLFIPMTELWLYLWMGEAHQFWIKIIFPLYYAAGAILLATTARRLTNRRWPGLAASVLLFFVPFLSNSPGNATGGYVDVPLSILYLATMAYLIVYAINREAYALRVFAVSLALLPWAKREGAILWLIAALCGAVVIWRGSRSWRSLLWLLPGAAIVVAWKIFLHAMHTIEAREFGPMTFGTLQANLSRTIPIGKMVMAEMLETQRWSLFWPCVALAFTGLAFRARDSRLLLLVIAVAAPVTLYGATYLFSIWPDYSMHFQASFPRLLLHVMPVAWLAIALAMPWAKRIQSRPSGDNQKPAIVQRPCDSGRPTFDASAIRLFASFK